MSNKLRKMEKNIAIRERKSDCERRHKCRYFDVAKNTCAYCKDYKKEKQ